VDVLEHLRINGLAFGFDIRDLTANHPIDRAGSGCNFCEDGAAALRRGRRPTDGFEGKRQKSVTREDGDGFAEFLVARGFAAAEVIVVEGRQVIVNQGVGVDEFDGAGRMERGGDIAGENSRRLETQDRTNSFSTGKDAVTHGCMDGSGLRGRQRKEPLKSSIDGETVLLEKWGKFHR